MESSERTMIADRKMNFFHMVHSEDSTHPTADSK